MPVLKPAQKTKRVFKLGSQVIPKSKEYNEINKKNISKISFNGRFRSIIHP
ncbi:hypothetical protein ADICYQ_1998 [Cyclobacterium qasimii M12-11B]|uniref:Uncharacterized protein n=1 Tax=Cyclobacterium qasimii M12-11B TaxID=641524 RepID=S7WYG2_9BACT|nr:hypothetical protein ADICYQ_1998 [Cyclobacterium qasimii M12-11B]